MPSSPSPSSSDWTFARRLVMVAAAVALMYAAYQLSYVILLVFAAVLVAVLLRTVVRGLSGWLGLPEAWALGVAVVALLGLLGAFFSVFGVQLYAQIREVIELLPGALQKLGDQLGMDLEISRSKLQEWARGSATSGTLPSALGYGSSVLGVLADFLIVLVGGIFLAADPRLYVRGAALLLPRGRRAGFEAALQEAGQALRLWFGGQLLAMLALGLLSWLAYWAIGLPSAPALGLMAGLADFVPFIGPILGAIPALVIAATRDLQTALMTLGAVVLIQQIESYVLMPFIQRKAVKLPPAVGIFSILVFGTLFGFIGIVLAVPLAVALMVLVQRLWVNGVLGADVDVVGQPGEDAD